MLSMWRGPLFPGYTERDQGRTTPGEGRGGGGGWRLYPPKGYLYICVTPLERFSAFPAILPFAPFYPYSILFTVFFSSFSLSHYTDYLAFTRRWQWILG
jgi:hypothetical protein